MRWIIPLFILIIAVAAGGLAAQSCSHMVR